MVTGEVCVSTERGLLQQFTSPAMTYLLVYMWKHKNLPYVHLNSPAPAVILDATFSICGASCIHNH